MLIARSMSVLLLATALWAGDHRQPDAGGALGAHCGALTLERTCAVADFDGDQLQDLAAARHASRSRGLSALRVSLSGSGREQVVDLSRWPHAAGVFSRDVDGDRDRDLVITNGEREALAVFLNDGRGTFAFDARDAFLAVREAEGLRLQTRAALPRWVAESDEPPSAAALAVVTARGGCAAAEQASLAAESPRVLRPFLAGALRIRAP